MTDEKKYIITARVERLASDVEEKVEWLGSEPPTDEDLLQVFYDVLPDLISSSVSYEEAQDD